MDKRYPNPVVTFLPVHDSAVLLIQRPADEEHYAGKWAFPGGRIEMGETVVEALLRELDEETGLTATGEICFLDSYRFASSVGIAFGVKVTDHQVSTVDGDDFAWISSIKEMQSYDRIAGIDNHVEALFEALPKPERWVPTQQTNLVPPIYLNL